MLRFDKTKVAKKEFYGAKKLGMMMFLIQFISKLIETKKT